MNWIYLYIIDFISIYFYQWKIKWEFIVLLQKILSVDIFNNEYFYIENFNYEINSRINIINNDF